MGSQGKVSVRYTDLFETRTGHRVRAPPEAFVFSFDRMHCYSKVNCLLFASCGNTSQDTPSAWSQHLHLCCTDPFGFFEKLGCDQIFHKVLWAVTIALSCLLCCSNFIDLALWGGGGGGIKEKWAMNFFFLRIQFFILGIEFSVLDLGTSGELPCHLLARRSQAKISTFCALVFPSVKWRWCLLYSPLRIFETSDELIALKMLWVSKKCYTLICVNSLKLMVLVFPEVS